MHNAVYILHWPSGLKRLITVFFVSQVKDLFLNLGESLVGKTCGFLGLGKIGLATARRWTSLDLWDLGLWTVVCSISLWG